MLLGFVVVDVVVFDELLLGCVVLDVLEPDEDELMLSDDSAVLFSEETVLDELGSSISELAESSGSSIDSSTDSSGCSSIGVALSLSGIITSSTGASLLSGTMPALSIVPVSTIGEDSLIISPAFNAPLRILTSPPIKTKRPQIPITIFFMNVSLLNQTKE